ncbi:MAG: LemA family protein [Ectothiorhodospiraceae bacterium]|nr:LemA family protein [Chromatiales bacterium]MCP5156375.1 LemA family protein [Ectothiorhodospiraceae bacterium]
MGSGAVTLIVVLGGLGWAAYAFNALVRDRNRVRAAWSDIDVQLERRHALVPRLVEITRGYAAHERATLDAVTRAREESVGAGRVGEKSTAEGRLEHSVQRMLALAEAYPDLKADSTFLELHQSLVDTENRIQHARRYYNGAVRMLNTRIESFPDLVVARAFRFTLAEFFQVEAEDNRDAPRMEKTWRS